MSQECSYCGFPTVNEEEQCIKCLPPRFRKIMGRYNHQSVGAIMQE